MGSDFETVKRSVLADFKAEPTMSENEKLVEQLREALAAAAAALTAAEARIKMLEERETFLRGRRGALVIERDTARAHAENLIAAIENDRKTSSLHDWDARMKRAVADARQALTHGDSNDG